MKQREHLGKSAYEAYWRFSEGKSLVTNGTLPLWKDLKPEIKEAWMVAANSVRLEIVGILMKWISEGEDA